MRKQRVRVGKPTLGSESSFGKRHRRSLNAAGKAGRRKFLIRDHNSGKNYLVDTGACASVIPATAHARKCQEGESFGNASGGGIKTYGTSQIPLHFGEGHRFTQTFTIADVTQPILGFDFFEHNRLKIMLKTVFSSIMKTAEQFARFFPTISRVSWISIHSC